MMDRHSSTTIFSSEVNVCPFNHCPTEGISFRMARNYVCLYLCERGRKCKRSKADGDCADSENLAFPYGNPPFPRGRKLSFESMEFRSDFFFSYPFSFPNWKQSENEGKEKQKKLPVLARTRLLDKNEGNLKRETRHNRYKESSL